MELELDEISEESSAFKQGFNNAYLLAQHEPGLLQDVISSLNPSNDYFDGFFSGKAQWELERLNSLETENDKQALSNIQNTEQNELDELQSLRDEANEQDRDLEMD